MNGHQHICPRCSKQVYYAEEIIAFGKHWHKSCFTCANKDCKRRLDSTNCSERDGEGYCKYCYGKLFGPKGYGFGQGAGVLQTDEASSGPTTNGNLVQHRMSYTGTNDKPYMVNGTKSHRGSVHLRDKVWGGNQECHRCSKPVYQAEKMMAGGFIYLFNHFSTCGPRTNNHVEGFNNSLSAKLDHAHPRLALFLVRLQEFHHSDQVRIRSLLNGATAAQRNPAYVLNDQHLEQAKSAFRQFFISVHSGQAWHRTSCFTCGVCGKQLQSTSICERDDDIFCKTCYSKNFGPKGYGFGQGAGVLSMDSDDSVDTPPRNVSSYHKAQVAAVLAEPLTISDGSLTHQNASTTIRSYGITERCRRCSKPVYLAEKLVAAGSPWHKNTCFTCESCGQYLQSTSLCERNGEIYCKTCYGRLFGPKGYGYGIGAGVLQMQQ